MRLLNVTTYKLEEFLESHVPIYAALSHTWGQDEVLYGDIQHIKRAKKKAGFAKIAYTCRQAKSDGLDYAWIDTCCIDKSSSAELQEAINSMYRWYEEATVCYAYLVDVVNSTDVGEQQFRYSAWFHRGWTLQELIAPPEVKFYNSEWTPLGKRSSMLDLITSITGVDTPILSHSAVLSSISVAKRMSWAASRRTSRIEDLAYCLIGLFEVSIPMLYGEGSRSFMRLQEEILRTSNDHSIFAWGAAMSRKTNALLASYPSDFAHCHDTVLWGRPGQYEMTSRGVRIRLPVIRSGRKATELLSSEHENTEYLAILNCRAEDELGGTTALRLQRNHEHGDYNISCITGATELTDSGIHSRLAVVDLDSLSNAETALVEIARTFEPPVSPIKFWFRLSHDASYDVDHPLTVVDHYPKGCWNAKRTIMQPELFYNMDTRKDRLYRPGRRLARGVGLIGERTGTAMPVRGAVTLHSMRSEKALSIVFGIDDVPTRGTGQDDRPIMTLRWTPVVRIEQADPEGLQAACSRLEGCDHTFGFCRLQSRSRCPYLTTMIAESWQNAPLVTPELQGSIPINGGFEPPSRTTTPAGDDDVDRVEDFLQDFNFLDSPDQKRRSLPETKPPFGDEIITTSIRESHVMGEINFIIDVTASCRLELSGEDARVGLETTKRDGVLQSPLSPAPRSDSPGDARLGALPEMEALDVDTRQHPRDDAVTNGYS